VRRVRKQNLLTSVLVLFISLFIYFAQQQGWLDSAGKAVESNQPGLYPVSHYVDGDTITVNMNGKDETIRFVGVDTPETHKPNTPVQCYGPAAAAYTKNLISTAGGKVRLASDPESTNRDRYDRLLRYVYVPDGRLVNQELIKNGYGFYYPYFPFTKSKEFEAAQKSAMAGSKGLWGNCQPIAKDQGGYESNPQ
jgi:endonuclease YncB( thermonuclease family)